MGWAPLPAPHARKGARRYHYYVSKALQEGTLADRSNGIRLPARKVGIIARIRLCPCDKGKLIMRRGVTDDFHVRRITAPPERLQHGVALQTT